MEKFLLEIQLRATRNSRIFDTWLGTLYFLDAYWRDYHKEEFKENFDKVQWGND